MGEFSFQACGNAPSCWFGGAAIGDKTDNVILTQRECVMKNNITIRIDKSGPEFAQFWKAKKALEDYLNGLRLPEEQKDKLFELIADYQIAAEHDVALYGCGIGIKLGRKIALRDHGEGA